MAGRFTILRSSAGAGKTHALVRTYLRLCLASPGPDAYRRILALTFTNKAAHEMKQRVLKVLEALAAGRTDEGGVNDIRKGILQHVACSPDQLTIKAAELHHHMLHHWSDLSITTIDAFMRRLVRPFARDLQLDQDLRMTTAQADYRARAVEDLLAQAGTPEAPTELLIRIGEALVEEESAWVVSSPLLQLAEELDRERAAAPLRTYAGIPPDLFLATERQLKQEKERWEQKVRKVGAEGSRLLRSVSDEPKDFAGGAKGVHSTFQQLSRFSGKWPATTNFSGTVATNIWHSGSASASVKAALSSLSDRLAEVGREVMRLQEEELPDHLVRNAIRRDLLPAAALHLVHEQLEQIKRGDRVHFFSDLTRRVVEIVHEDPAPFIYEQLGARYRHFLLDEFQDTSVSQWHALLPLVENALSEGGEVFLVGDAKQAIYRWRNGDVEQFIALPGLHDAHALPRATELEAQLRANAEVAAPLVDNRRSGRAIIATNNALFSHLATALPERLQGVYDACAQESFREREGYVQLEIVRKGADHTEEEDEEQERIDASKPELIRLKEWLRTCQQDGFTWSDIAVLVYTGKQAADVSMLIQDLSIPVRSKDGQRLLQDHSACAVMDLIRYLYRPDVTVAIRVLQHRASLASSGAATVDPLAELDLALGPMEHVELLLRESGPAATSGPLSDLVEWCGRWYGLHPAASPGLLTWLDEVVAFQEQGGAGLGELIMHWEASGSKRMVQGRHGVDAVQVMTVHTAKGLQFPVVMMPWTIRNKNGKKLDRLWITTERWADELGTSLVRVEKQLEPHVPEVAHELELSRLEETNLLYVGFTRPEERLYGCVIHSKNATGLHGALQGYIGIHGHDDILHAGTAAPAPARAPQAPNPGAYMQVNVGPTAPLVRANAPDEWDPASPDLYRRHGTVLHAVLARMTHPDELPVLLKQACRTGQLAETEALELMPALVGAFQHPAVATLFATGVSVWKEATLIADGSTFPRPDRIVEDAHGIHVLDYKFASPRREHHEQVAGYMHLLRSIHPDRTVSGLLLYLPKGEVVPVA